MYKTNFEEPNLDPFPRLHIPEHHVIKLAPEDAAEFHAGLERTRAALEKPHWLKNKDLGDFQNPNASMLVINNDEGELVAGALVTPFNRELGKKMAWYPWDAKGPYTGLLSSVWTDAAYAKKGMATAIIKKAIEEIKTSPHISDDPDFGGLRYILAGVAEDNVGSSKMLAKLGLREFRSLERDPIHGNPMIYMRRGII